MELKGKKILIGISASIAAYKTITLVRLLIKAGAEVKVIMTPSSEVFVSPLVLSTLSKNHVYTGLAVGNNWENHVMLGRWADLFIIVPASCNTIAKMANGLCDNMLLAVYLSATCNVWVAPAMDEDMWEHATTRRNLALLASYGNKILDVGDGELASGLIGKGRVAEPEEILAWIKNEFIFKDELLKGKKVLITAGPTYENIDPVRFIGNFSSGKMGISIAEAFYNKGAEVNLVLGPSKELVPEGINVISVRSAQQMYDACLQRFPDTDIAVMSAAVADFRPKTLADEKIKKQDDEGMVIELVRNPDILKACGAIKTDRQLLVGFALETNNEEENALGKLRRKNADMIVLNSLNDEKAGFGTDTNKVTIFDKNGTIHRWPLRSKQELGIQLVDLMIEKINESK